MVHTLTHLLCLQIRLINRLSHLDLALEDISPRSRVGLSMHGPVHEQQKTYHQAAWALVCTCAL